MPQNQKKKYMMKFSKHSQRKLGYDEETKLPRHN